MAAEMQRSGVPMAIADYTTGFDHFDPEYAADPVSVWRDLRDRCPVARGARLRGMWVPTRHDDIVAIAHDVEHFSSRSPVVTDVIPMSEMGIIAPPISSDPPYHTEIRRMLLPFFAPKRIEALRPSVEALADGLIDAILERGDGRCDAAAEYAQHIPVRVIAEMLGVPPEEGDRFREWVHILLEVAPGNLEGTIQEGMFSLMEFLTYFRERMVERRAEPRDDIVSYLVDAEIGDPEAPGGTRPLSDQEVLGVCLLLLLAGIDTTWSSIGSAIWHLAQHPDDAQRLRDDPSLWGTAIEELLRAYSPVTMAREVAVDVDFAGCPMKAGDPLLLPFPAANRDPAFFTDPDEVIIDRAENRHVAFGVGIHRCLGSNLARLEVQVATQRFVERIAEFSLADPGAVTWSVGQVRGPRSLPLTISA
jgi:cytochrome P450